MPKATKKPTTKMPTDDLSTPEKIREAMLRTEAREPTDDEYDGLDGLDRGDYFLRGYETALREFAARLPWAGQVWTDALLPELGDVKAKLLYGEAPIREGRVVALHPRDGVQIEVDGKTVSVARDRIFLVPGRKQWETPPVPDEMLFALLGKVR